MTDSSLEMLIIQADKQREETIKMREQKANKARIKEAERENDEALIKKDQWNG